ncbi:MAG: RIP metalloprotease RseP [Planctomycetota bacterium]|nr:RIP metalloprotease RseP [Planctomycetota bacterium]
MSIFFIIQVVLGFGMLIFVHELGHFLVAKWVGIRVEKFSLGFGPTIFGFTRGDTEYVISYIPLGGYVKMAGEMAIPGEDPKLDEFFGKKPWERAAVIIAGPAMNIIFAIPAAMLVYLIGINQPSTLVGVAENSVAARAGIPDGSRITAIDGQMVLSFPEVRLRLMLADFGTEHTISYLDPEGLTQTKTVKADEDSKDIGFGPYSGTTIWDVEPESPSAKAGLRRGDRITQIDGQDMTRWPAILEYIETNPGKEVSLVYERTKPSENQHPSYEAPTTVKATISRSKVVDFGTERQDFALAAAGKLMPGGPAEKAGIKKDDLILEIGGEKIENWSEMHRKVQNSLGKKQAFKVRRGDKIIEVDITPMPSPANPEIGIIGIHSGPWGSKVLGTTNEEDPTAPAGLLSGDLMVGVDGLDFSGEKQPFKSRWKKKLGGDEVNDATRWVDSAMFQNYVASKKGKEIKLTVLRADAAGELQTHIIAVTPKEIEKGDLGLQPGAFETVFRQYGFAGAVGQSFAETRKIVFDTGLSFYRLFTGGISLKNIGGPIGISTALFYKAQEGFTEFVHLLVIISINLALINLLPIPILDGGHLLLMAIEKIKGQPVKEKTMAIAQYVALAFLLALVVFATRNDIVNFNFF